MTLHPHLVNDLHDSLRWKLSDLSPSFFFYPPSCIHHLRLSSFCVGRQHPPPVTSSSLPLDSGFHSLPFSGTFLSQVNPLFCFSNFWLLCRIILDSIHSALVLIIFFKTCHLPDPNTSISLLHFMVIYACSLNVSAAIVSWITPVWLASSSPHHCNTASRDEIPIALCVVRSVDSSHSFLY